MILDWFSCVKPIFFSTSTTFCYFVANNYPKADYLEYPFLLFQSLILFSLVAYYRSYPALKCVGVFILYILLVYGFAHQILPYMLLQLMATVRNELKHHHSVVISSLF